MTVDTNSKWYPYLKVHEGYIDLSDTVNLPRKICDYLIDAPIPTVYEPKDDNSYPRCRLWKYLYYDGANPLAETLPTIQQKKTVIFDSASPENAPTEKGYRLIPQIYIKPADINARTQIYITMGRTVPSGNEYKMALSVVFRIFTHYQYELNTRTDEYSRCFAIEQALIESFHGVNIAGLGTFYFSKNKHADCGSRAIFDGNTNVGRELTIALEIATDTDNTQNEFDNMPFLTADGSIRLA